MDPTPANDWLVTEADAQRIKCPACGEYADDGEHGIEFAEEITEYRIVGQVNPEGEVVITWQNNIDPGEGHGGHLECRACEHQSAGMGDLKVDWQ